MHKLFLSMSYTPPDKVILFIELSDNTWYVRIRLLILYLKLYIKRDVGLCLEHLDIHYRFTVSNLVS